MQFVQKLLKLKACILLVISISLNFLIYKLFERKNIYRNEEDISGKCVVVTGGSNGIGRSSAREFAQRGATVVIGDVDVENGRKTVREIQEQTGNMNVSMFRLDLSSMTSVEEFARKVSADHPKIKILFNNAGIGGSKDENIQTKDGFNIHVAVNYMGHFLLTNLLMKNLEAEINPRVVTTTSVLMLMEELDLADINMHKSGFGLQNLLPYCNTKYCLALFTKELAKRSQIHANALCPGPVNTAINTTKDVAAASRFFLRILMRLTATPDQAASEHVMFCALENNIECGKVYRFRKLFHKLNNKLDDKLASDLWEKSAELLRLNERLAKFEAS